MISQNEEDFEALITAIQCTYRLNGLGVCVIYVQKDLWEWMQKQYDNFKRDGTWEKGGCLESFAKARPERKKTNKGKIRFTIRPEEYEYISIKEKPLMVAPWKIIVQYKGLGKSKGKGGKEE